jgi:hypothetical protein
MYEINILVDEMQKDLMIDQHKSKHRDELNHFTSSRASSRGWNKETFNLQKNEGLTDRPSQQKAAQEYREHYCYSYT